MADYTKRTTLKKMLPADHVRDLERDKALKTYDAAFKFVIEQVPLRKDCKVLKKSPNDMDVDVVEMVPPTTNYSTLSPSTSSPTACSSPSSSSTVQLL